MKTKLITVYLAVSGLMLLAIGLGILLAPTAFHAANGIALGTDSSLLSEVRAPGGLLAACALLILAGVVQLHRRALSLQLTVLVYGTFGVSRLLGMLLDGLPSGGIVAATGVELIVAILGGLALFYSRRQQITDQAPGAVPLRTSN